jgi:hypothetical protein
VNEEGEIEMKQRLGETANRRSLPFVPFVTSASTFERFNHSTSAKP